MMRRNIKIPSDFFDRDRIVELEKFPNREELILLYLHLLTISAKHNYVFFNSKYCFGRRCSFNHF